MAAASPSASRSRLGFALLALALALSVTACRHTTPGDGGDGGLGDGEPTGPVVVDNPPLPSTCAIDCPAGFKTCGGKCVGLDDPAYGCGATSCTSCNVAHANAKCEGGTCAVDTCHAGWADCGGGAGCESDLSAAGTCGSCSVACTSGLRCSPTGCVASCTPPLTDCGTTCVDLATSTTHCGSCSSATSVCSDPGFAVMATCETGSCGFDCAPGFTNCDGRCFDLTRDPNNCGACGNACTGDDGKTLRACKAGSCGGCTGGLSECPGSACVDLSRAHFACGACGVSCDSKTQVCRAGACVTLNTTIAVAKAPEDIALDATNVYWSDLSEGTISTVPKSGGATRVLAKGLSQPVRLALDDAFVYWVDTLGAAVMRVPKAGGVPMVVASAKEPIDLALDDSWVYWLNRTDQTVATAPKSGGDALVIAAGANGKNIAVAGGHVYYVHNASPTADPPGGIWQVPDNGGPPTLVLPMWDTGIGWSYVDLFATDGNALCMIHSGPDRYASVGSIVTGKFVPYPGTGDTITLFYSSVRIERGRCFLSVEPAGSVYSCDLCDLKRHWGTRSFLEPIHGFAVDNELVYYTTPGAIRRVPLTPGRWFE